MKREGFTSLTASRFLAACDAALASAHSDNDRIDLYNVISEEQKRKD